MKLMISFLLLILSLNFCSNQIEPENLDLKLTYFVTDSLGNEKYSFTQNEEFQVKFEIKNNSDKELTFDISLPVVGLSIKKDGETICNSTDYMNVCRSLA